MSETIGVSQLPIHDLGTLRNITRWITRHEDGVAEWLKNVRAAYYENRANVNPEDRVAVILIKDHYKDEPARIGVLDVGGFTFEDVERWSLWNDPDAASRGGKKFEENQGNGGKAYMYKLFKGPAYILGVKDNLLNQAGFVGENDTCERGLPRFYPASNNLVRPKGGHVKYNRGYADILIEDWKEELVKHLQKFDTGWYRLPSKVQEVLEKRKCFTIVIGEDPTDWSEGKSNIKQFIKQVIRNPQATRAIRQVKFYVIYNDTLLFRGKPLELEKVDPFPGFEDPIEYPIPEILETPGGKKVNTTISKTGKHPLGKITLFTSRDNMELSWKTLKPRWTVNYETQYEDIGQKSISEIVPSTPGSQYIYAVVHLDALSPDSVDMGRKRPNPTDLVRAVDMFLAKKSGN